MIDWKGTIISNYVQKVMKNNVEKRTEGNQQIFAENVLRN